MKILYIGDIMGEPGIKAVESVLPKIKKEHRIDVVIAQGENVSGGRGITRADFERLRKIGVDFFTGGNWTSHREETSGLLEDPSQPIIRPANYPNGTSGKGWKYFASKNLNVLIISLLGQVIGRQANEETDNPLQVIDEILEANKAVKRDATIVNFHGDYSSEKRVIGYYLDGKVSAVIGDHWHVPTADAMVLPKGTAHITDVGMCGSLHSSLGVRLDVIIPRWRDGQRNQNELENDGPLQFNAVVVDVDMRGLAKSIKPIQIADL
jgi:metallophosphoesterase (TIGR00282 family)